MLAGASPHAVRIIAAAEDLAAQGEEYELLLAHLGDAGLPGAPDHQVPRLLGHLRPAPPGPPPLPQQPRRPRTRRGHPSVLDDDDDVPDGFELVSSWVFDGQGYLDLDQAAAAVESAARARIRAGRRVETIHHPEEQR